MFKVVETFSGIGSQSKALSNIGIEYEVTNTVEWDIHAIIAYDLIHNGEPNLDKYEDLSKEQLISDLLKYTLSNDGKKPIELNSLKLMSKETLSRLSFAIERTKNLVSITDVTASDLEDNLDLLTYSFPCQDLSICGAWHGNSSGIDRTANNRSGMLWEIERILKEFIEVGKRPPKFLLMENVSNILSETHKYNFQEWSEYLEEIGYTNQLYTLNAADFGIPQRRIRTYMISVLTGTGNVRSSVIKYFENNDIAKRDPIRIESLKDFLRIDYEIPKYRIEAEMSNPNFTPSRQKIYEENSLVFDGERVTCATVKTITTKQDRNPNSGLVKYCGESESSAPYRNLTPRECFLLMGFDESDFDRLVEHNFDVKKNQFFFTREKLIKMAGNSIVVGVLEEIFKQIININDSILKQTSVNNEDLESNIA